MLGLCGELGFGALPAMDADGRPRLRPSAMMALVSAVAVCVVFFIVILLECMGSGSV